MKRELKFRVWDNVDYMTTFNITDIVSRKILYTSDCPVMQYVGLKDKNGKDVYEGDIMQHCFDDHLFNWLISFSDGAFVLRNIGVDGYLMDTFPLTGNDTKNRIIIGNIYENPELLKTIVTDFVTDSKKPEETTGHKKS